MSKRWNREAVIDAIQRWAAENGRPPMVHEMGPQFGDYPSRHSVFGKDGQPFEKWADAVEAAGFPRPKRGRPQNGRKPVVQHMVVEVEEKFVVFEWVSTGESLPAYVQVAIVDAASPEKAIEKAASREGDFTAVPLREMEPQPVRHTLTILRTQEVQLV